MSSLPLISIVGPTSTGKSSLGLELAQAFQGGIISADSRQIYQEFTIGSGKLLPEQRQNIPHYMLDIRHIWENFNVWEFQTEALAIIKNIHKQVKIPFLVGGTGLYIDSIIKGYSIPQTPPDQSLRQILSTQSLKSLQQHYLQLYPQPNLNQSDWHNPVRLIRAIEKRMTPSQQNQTSKTDPEYDQLILGLRASKDTLLDNISTRVDQRLDNRVIEEVAEMKNILLTHLAEPETNQKLSQFGLGTRLITQYLDQPTSLAQLREAYIRAEWQYARRQLTWFSCNKAIIWLELEDKTCLKKAFNLTQGFLARRV